VVLDEHLGDPIDWFVLEHSNLVSAVELAAQLGHADLCWDLAMTSVTLFEARAYTDSWARTVKIAMDACRDAGDERGEAAMWYASAGLALVQGRLSDAESEYEKALEYFEKHGDTHGCGLTQRILGFVDWLKGRTAEALGRYEQALDYLREVGDRFAEANVLSWMAQVMQVEPESHDEAARFLRAALEISVEIGAIRSEAQVRNRLGQLLLAQAKPDEAEMEFRAVLHAVVTVGDPVGTTYAHLGIGLVHLARHEWVSADAALRDARAVADHTGDRLSLGRVLLAQAETAWQADDQDATSSILAEAREVLAATDHWLAQVDELEQRLTNQT
jgi:tetratricopeptide (TPR) repeat protein